jgi:hypothetical protein
VKNRTVRPDGVSTSAKGRAAGAPGASGATSTREYAGTMLAEPELSGKPSPPIVARFSGKSQA